MAQKKQSIEPKRGFFSFLRRKQKEKKEKKEAQHGLPPLTEDDMKEIEAQSRYSY
jgi:hypothetical protein